MKKLDKTAQTNSFIILILFFAGLVMSFSIFVSKGLNLPQQEYVLFNLANGQTSIMRRS